MADETPTIKFAQWRPIGVCDNGPPNQRKAQLFSKPDFAIVTAPGVTRENWRQHPEVLKLIRRYAQDVAKLSGEAQAMKRPEIDTIHLVGTILGHTRTPTANAESTEGRVQLFEVKFKDARANKNPRKRRWWLWLVGAISTVLLLGWTISQLSLPLKLGSTTVKPTVGMRQICIPGQGDSFAELQALRRPVLQFLKTLPNWSSLSQIRRVCGSGFRSLQDQQQRTVRCVVAVNREVPELNRSGKAGFAKLRSCADNLCQSGFAGLGPYCPQLGR
ncbi:MAG: hypothetical protein CL929_02450 [Deltaproteobacteria bacterium]|jgi:hypothetical protein|nr:hypothetical protein [Deltaproteobacteria bacterium]|tara:strand:- start:227 stop:1048 length:822 start_codon:yes stop_codon:yes gene_type:complete